LAEAGSGPGKTVLVTGGTGFIGGYLFRRLAAKGGVRLRRLVRPREGRALDPATDLPGTLDRDEDVRRFAGSGDCLIHLACTTNPRSSNADILADLRQNLLTSVCLFGEFLRRNPGGHVLFGSTGGDIYNYGPPHVPRRESDPAMPHSSYSIHKLAAENYLSLLCALHGGRGSVLRIGNPYGERVSEGRGHGLVGIALEKALLGHELQVFEPVNSVRDYLHLEDLGRAFDAVLADPPAAGACELFNLGSGIGHSIGDVIAIVEEVTGRRLARRSVIPPGRRATWNVLDIARFSGRFAWSPRVSFEEGVRRLWAEVSAAGSGN